MSAKRATLALACLASLALVGCTNPDAPTATQPAATARQPGNAGEPNPPPPPSPASQVPFGVQRTPQRALAWYATRYTNWDYRTLGEDQEALARASIGAARLAEEQAAARSRHDTTLARAGIWNHGEIISIAQDLRTPAYWVIVTREHTGGNSEYQGLPASYHITLAKLAAVPGGYAIEQWLPEN